jgi:tetratricopeptide (TPR) repeat protein
VETYKRLAVTNPDAFLPDLASSLNNLSNRESDVGHRAEALASITRAVESYERLASTNPEAFLPDLAMSLSNLSSCHSDMGHPEEALASITRVAEIYETLAVRLPAVFTSRLARTLGLQGAYLWLLGRSREAEEACSRSLDADPGNVAAHGALTMMQAAAGRMIEALGGLRALAAKDDNREERVSAVISVSVSLAAAGSARKALEIVTSSALGPYLEPLIVALRKLLGEDVSAPLEVEEIAEDLLRQIREASHETSASGAPVEPQVRMRSSHKRKE